MEPVLLILFFICLSCLLVLAGLGALVFLFRRSLILSYSFQRQRQESFPSAIDGEFTVAPPDSPPSSSPLALPAGEAESGQETGR